MMSREYLGVLIFYITPEVSYIHKLDFTEKTLHPEHRPSSSRLFVPSL